MRIAHGHSPFFPRTPSTDTTAKPILARCSMVSINAQSTGKLDFMWRAYRTTVESRPRRCLRRGFWGTAPAFMGDSRARNGAMVNQLDEIRRAAADLRRLFSDVPMVTPAELHSWSQSRAAQIVVIDVRGPEEQMISMLPGAVKVSDFCLEDYRPEAILVAYCTIGYRSAMLAREWRRCQREVFSLDGGILAWCHAGLPITEREQPTMWVHVYSADWSLLPPGFAATW